MEKHVGLVTDFGTKAGYVASMKGVILSTCPECIITDLSHEIPPQNIMEAALFLENCCHYFPENYIFVIVVDPGVGSSRRILALRTKRLNQFFVAPDNGVLDLIIKDQGVGELIVLENKEFWRPSTSHTFHGRDIMSPVAAHVANGVAINELGSSLGISEIIHLDIPSSEFIDASREILGAVLYLDNFGNIITNITKDSLDKATISINDYLLVNIDGSREMSVPFKNFYSEVEPGSFVCLLNSENRFEISINEGNAADVLQNISKFKKVTVKKHG
ncbi:MAG: S-adenosyl-l-methionine hydroxide adenosyltransferase family protein [Candidatus Hodarchaeota archaeon]